MILRDKNVSFKIVPIVQLTIAIKEIYSFCGPYFIFLLIFFQPFLSHVSDHLVLKGNACFLNKADRPRQPAETIQYVSIDERRLGEGSIFQVR